MYERTRKLNFEMLFVVVIKTRSSCIAGDGDIDAMRICNTGCEIYSGIVSPHNFLGNWFNGAWEEYFFGQKYLRFLCSFSSFESKPLT